MTPEQDRQLLELQASGLTFREMGDVLGITGNAVKGRLFRLTHPKPKHEYKNKGFRAGAAATTVKYPETVDFGKGFCGQDVG